MNPFRKIMLIAACAVFAVGAQAAFARCEPGATCRSFLEQALDAIHQSSVCVKCSVEKDRGQAGFTLDCKIRCAMRPGSGNSGGGEDAAQGAYQVVRMPAYAPVPPLQAMPPAPSFWGALFPRR